MQNKHVVWGFVLLALMFFPLFARTQNVLAEEVVPRSVKTDNTPDAELFQKGLKYYQEGKYKEAETTFLKILHDYPDTRYLTAVKLMLGKSFYKLGDYHSATIVCNNFKNKHYFSNYLDDIHFLQGQIYFREQKYLPAVEEWLWLVYHDADPRLKKKAGLYVYQTMLHYLSEQDIRKLQKTFPDETFAGLVEIVKAQKLIQSGRRDEGYQRLSAFVEAQPGHFFADLARMILSGRSGARVSSRTILILKTDDPQMKIASDHLTAGAMYAAYEMQQRNPQQALSIDTMVVEPGVLSVLQTLMPIMEKQPPLAVIGPTGNDENAAISLYSRCEHFPFVAPFSSQNGLAALSPYAFQINPDAETKGAFLADYAVHELGLKTFAILAPADNYGEAIARSFQQTVEANGGEVVEVQWFYEDAQDFSRQLKAIRKKGFYIAFRDSVRQADSTLSDQEIQQKFKQYMTEVLFSSDLRGKVDSTQVPSTGIDGVFIAIYPDLIPFISSQFVFQNIQTTLLGNEGWYDPEQLIQQSNYLNGLIFITAGYLDKESWNYREFTTRFRTVMHQTPDRYHLLGYDIAKWMMSNYQPGMDRQGFRDKLESAGTYRGILEDIVFKQKPRVNSSLNVIKFQMGQLIKLK